MRLPVGMTRRALSYDDNLEAPMSTPPHNISINNLWRRPVIPERRAAGVVKTKASSSIVNSLITKQTQDSMQTFEQRVGLSNSSYTPHKGLTAEETKHHHRVPDSLQKLQIQSLESREERLASSTQSTPSSTPHSSPKQQRRGWFSGAGSDLSSSSSSSIDIGESAGGGVAGGGTVERWSAFGPRPPVHKSTSDLGSEPSSAAGFALQAYRGANKPTPMEVMKAQSTRLADNPAAQMAPPKMEIPTTEARRPGARPHKLRHRDMNVLTPSGF
ncbi:hypothetical protein fugu_008557 [Takifugu bimaculatus]|uniref:Putative monooxygenase p33MONOX n=2 Tax=Takifugu bimaculatus TaxID=433685 RepID=A0A4Z2AXU7_9TELE|nr:hypothetical protein fugu_008557 [Takifugu bimaculatus]